MKPPPWRTVLRRESYSIISGNQTIAYIDPQMPRKEQADHARAIAILPDLLELLADVEDWLGDRPRSDVMALSFHERATKILNAADIRLRSEDEK